MEDLHLQGWHVFEEQLQWGETVGEACLGASGWSAAKKHAAGGPVTEGD